MTQSPEQESAEGTTAFLQTVYHQESIAWLDGSRVEDAASEHNCQLLLTEFISLCFGPFTLRFNTPQSKTESGAKWLQESSPAEASAACALPTY